MDTVSGAVMPSRSTMAFAPAVCPADLKNGDEIDAFDLYTSTWQHAIVTGLEKRSARIDTDSTGDRTIETHEAEETLVRVHFVDWTVEFDEVISTWSGRIATRNHLPISVINIQRQPMNEPFSPSMSSGSHIVSKNSRNLPSSKYPPPQLDTTDDTLFSPISTKQVSPKSSSSGLSGNSSFNSPEQEGRVILKKPALTEHENTTDEIEKLKIVQAQEAEKLRLARLQLLKIKNLGNGEASDIEVIEDHGSGSESPIRQIRSKLSKLKGSSAPQSPMHLLEGNDSTVKVKKKVIHAISGAPSAIPSRTGSPKKSAAASPTTLSRRESISTKPAASTTPTVTGILFPEQSNPLASPLRLSAFSPVASLLKKEVQKLKHKAKYTEAEEARKREKKSVMRELDDQDVNKVIIPLSAVQARLMIEDEHKTAEQESLEKEKVEKQQKRVLEHTLTALLKACVPISTPVSLPAIRRASLGLATLAESEEGIEAIVNSAAGVAIDCIRRMIDESKDEECVTHHMKIVMRIACDAQWRDDGIDHGLVEMLFGLLRSSVFAASSATANGTTAANQSSGNGVANSQQVFHFETNIVPGARQFSFSILYMIAFSLSQFAVSSESHVDFISSFRLLLSLTEFSDHEIQQWGTLTCQCLMLNPIEKLLSIMEKEKVANVWMNVLADDASWEESKVHVLNTMGKLLFLCQDPTRLGTASESSVESLVSMRTQLLDSSMFRELNRLLSASLMMYSAEVSASSSYAKTDLQHLSSINAMFASPKMLHLQIIREILSILSTISKSSDLVSFSEQFLIYIPTFFQLLSANVFPNEVASSVLTIVSCVCENDAVHSKLFSFSASSLLSFLWHYCQSDDYDIQHQAFTILQSLTSHSIWHSSILKIPFLQLWHEKAKNISPLSDIVGTCLQSLVESDEGNAALLQNHDMVMDILNEAFQWKDDEPLTVDSENLPELSESDIQKRLTSLRIIQALATKAASVPLFTHYFSLLPETHFQFYFNLPDLSPLKALFSALIKELGGSVKLFQQIKFVKFLQNSTSKIISHLANEISFKLEQQDLLLPASVSLSASSGLDPSAHSLNTYVPTLMHYCDYANALLSRTLSASLPIAAKSLLPWLPTTMEIVTILPYLHARVASITTTSELSKVEFEIVNKAQSSIYALFSTVASLLNILMNDPGVSSSIFLSYRLEIFRFWIFWNSVFPDTQKESLLKAMFLMIQNKAVCSHWAQMIEFDATNTDSISNSSLKAIDFFNIFCALLYIHLSHSDPQIIRLSLLGFSQIFLSSSLVSASITSFSTEKNVTPLLPTFDFTFQEIFRTITPLLQSDIVEVRAATLCCIANCLSNSTPALPLFENIAEWVLEKLKFMERPDDQERKPKKNAGKVVIYGKECYQTLLPDEITITNEILLHLASRNDNLLFNFETLGQPSIIFAFCLNNYSIADTFQKRLNVLSFLYSYLRKFQIARIKKELPFESLERWNQLSSKLLSQLSTVLEEALDQDEVALTVYSFKLFEMFSECLKFSTFLSFGWEAIFNKSLDWIRKGLAAATNLPSIPNSSTTDNSMGKFLIGWNMKLCKFLFVFTQNLTRFSIQCQDPTDQNITDTTIASLINYYTFLSIENRVICERNENTTSPSLGSLSHEKELILYSYISLVSTSSSHSVAQQIERLETHISMIAEAFNHSFYIYQELCESPTPSDAMLKVHQAFLQLFSSSITSNSRAIQHLLDSKISSQSFTSLSGYNNSKSSQPTFIEFLSHSLTFFLKNPQHVSDIILKIFLSPLAINSSSLLPFNDDLVEAAMGLMKVSSVMNNHHHYFTIVTFLQKVFANNHFQFTNLEQNQIEIHFSRFCVHILEQVGTANLSISKPYINLLIQLILGILLNSSGNSDEKQDEFQKTLIQITKLKMLVPGKFFQVLTICMNDDMEFLLSVVKLLVSNKAFATLMFEDPTFIENIQSAIAIFNCAAVSQSPETEPTEMRRLVTMIWDIWNFMLSQLHFICNLSAFQAKPFSLEKVTASVSLTVEIFGTIACLDENNPETEYFSAFLDKERNSLIISSINSLLTLFSRFQTLKLQSDIIGHILSRVAICILSYVGKCLSEDDIENRTQAELALVHMCSTEFCSSWTAHAQECESFSRIFLSLIDHLKQIFKSSTHSKNDVEALDSLLSLSSILISSHPNRFTSAFIFDLLVLWKHDAIPCNIRASIVGVISILTSGTALNADEIYIPSILPIVLDELKKLRVINLNESADMQFYLKQLLLYLGSLPNQQQLLLPSEAHMELMDSLISLPKPLITQFSASPLLKQLCKSTYVLPNENLKSIEIHQLAEFGLKLVDLSENQLESVGSFALILAEIGLLFSNSKTSNHQLSLPMKEVNKWCTKQLLSPLPMKRLYRQCILLALATTSVDSNDKPATWSHILHAYRLEDLENQYCCQLFLCSVYTLTMPYSDPIQLDISVNDGFFLKAAMKIISSSSINNELRAVGRLLLVSVLSQYLSTPGLTYNEFNGIDLISFWKNAHIETYTNISSQLDSEAGNSKLSSLIIASQVLFFLLDKPEIVALPEMISRQSQSFINLAKSISRDSALEAPFYCYYESLLLIYPALLHSLHLVTQRHAVSSDVSLSTMVESILWAHTQTSQSEHTETSISMTSLAKSLLTAPEITSGEMKLVISTLPDINNFSSLLVLCAIAYRSSVGSINFRTIPDSDATFLLKFFRNKFASPDAEDQLFWMNIPAQLSYLNIFNLIIQENPLLIETLSMDIIEICTYFNQPVDAHEDEVKMQLISTSLYHCFLHLVPTSPIYIDLVKNLDLYSNFLSLYSYQFASSYRETRLVSLLWFCHNLGKIGNIPDKILTSLCLSLLQSIELQFGDEVKHSDHLTKGAAEFTGRAPSALLLHCIATLLNIFPRIPLSFLSTSVASSEVFMHALACAVASDGGPLKWAAFHWWGVFTEESLKFTSSYPQDAEHEPPPSIFYWYKIEFFINQLSSLYFTFTAPTPNPNPKKTDGPASVQSQIAYKFPPFPTYPNYDTIHDFAVNLNFLIHIFETHQDCQHLVKLSINHSLIEMYFSLLFTYVLRSQGKPSKSFNRLQSNLRIVLLTASLSAMDCKLPDPLFVINCCQKLIAFGQPRNLGYSNPIFKIDEAAISALLTFSYEDIMMKCPVENIYTTVLHLLQQYYEGIFDVEDQKENYEEHDHPYANLKRSKIPNYDGRIELIGKCLKLITQLNDTCHMIPTTNVSFRNTQLPRIFASLRPTISFFVLHLIAKVPTFNLAVLQILYFLTNDTQSSEILLTDPIFTKIHLVSRKYLKDPSHVLDSSSEEQASDLQDEIFWLLKLIKKLANAQSKSMPK